MFITSFKKMNYFEFAIAKSEKSQNCPYRTSKNSRKPRSLHKIFHHQIEFWFLSSRSPKGMKVQLQVVSFFVYYSNKIQFNTKNVTAFVMNTKRTIRPYFSRTFPSIFTGAICSGIEHWFLFSPTYHPYIKLM
jgi:hypothetical protein